MAPRQSRSSSAGRQKHPFWPCKACGFSSNHAWRDTCRDCGGEKPGNGKWGGGGYSNNGGGNHGQGGVRPWTRQQLPKADPKKSGLALAKSEGWMHPSQVAKLQKELDAAKAGSASGSSRSGGTDETGEDEEQGVDLGALHNIFTQLQTTLGEEHELTVKAKAEWERERTRRNNNKPVSVRMRELEHLVERKEKQAQTAAEAFEKCKKEFDKLQDDAKKKAQELLEARQELLETQKRAAAAGPPRTAAEPALSSAASALCADMGDDDEAKALIAQIQEKVRLKHAAAAATAAQAAPAAAVPAATPPAAATAPSPAAPAGGGSEAAAAPATGAAETDQDPADDAVDGMAAAQRADRLAVHYFSLTVPADQLRCRARIAALRVSAKASAARGAGGGVGERGSSRRRGPDGKPVEDNEEVESMEG